MIYTASDGTEFTAFDIRDDYDEVCNYTNDVSSKIKWFKFDDDGNIIPTTFTADDYDLIYFDISEEDVYDAIRFFEDFMNFYWFADETNIGDIYPKRYVYYDRGQNMFYDYESWFEEKAVDFELIKKQYLSAMNYEAEDNNKKTKGD